METRHARVLPEGRQGFTLVELLVVIAIVALLVALLLPALRGAIAGSRNARCLSNLSQIARAVAAYRCNPPHLLPRTAEVLELPDGVWICPANREAPAVTSYTYAQPFLPPWMMFDQRAWTNHVEMMDRGASRFVVCDQVPTFHGHTNAGFIDGPAGRLPN